jgi:UDP-N-acetylmuramate dehydrogenase
LDKTPKLNTKYDSIEEELLKLKKDNYTIKDISDVVCKIRMSKLPNPEKLGNAGSIFKNPEIPIKNYETIKSKFSMIPGYKISDQTIKVPAAWLIEKCGFKGKRFGQVGVHEKQALVIVNYGKGKPEEIIDLKNKIKQEVKDKFRIDLIEEVNII